MPGRVPVLLLGGVGILLLVCPRGLAQVEAPPPRDDAAGRPAAESAGIDEAKPEIFYLRDENGRLLPVPDLRLEEYQRLYNWHRKLTAPDPPPFLVEKLTIRGRALSTHAALEVDVQARLTERAESAAWVRLPLQFNDAVLRTPARHEGKGEFFVEYSVAEGYVAWLLAEEQTTHHIRLNLLVPLVDTGPNTRLSLRMPEAPASLQLTVPRPRIDATVNKPSAILLRQRKQANATELLVDVNGGELSLTWQAARPQLAKLPPRLDVHGSIRVSVEGLAQVSCEANLRVRSFGGVLDSFRVRLPPQMELISLEQPGYSVTVVGQADEKQADEQLVEVKLTSETSNEVNVRLLAQRTLREESASPPETGTPIEVASFDVLGAIRQRGHVDFVVDGEWALRWESDAAVRRLDELSESSRIQGVIARFEYYRQPCSLKVVAQRKKKYVSVEPHYDLLVGAGRVELLATLKYRVRGDTNFRLRLQLRDWVVDATDRGEVDGVNGLNFNEVDPLEIPVVVDDERLGTGFTVTVRAHRDFDIRQPQLSIPLPRPEDCAAEAATVTVRSATNVLLTPHPAARQGLIVESFSEASPLVEHRFRETSPGAAEQLTTNVTFHPRSLAVRVDGQINVSSTRIKVSETLVFDIAYEPLQQLVFEVPTAVWQDDEAELAVRLDGQPLTPGPLNDDSDPGDSRTKLVVDFPEERLGTTVLAVSYGMSRAALESPNAGQLLIPLVGCGGPDPLKVTSHVQQVRIEDDLELTLADSQWTTLDVQPGSLRLSGEGLPPALGFQIRALRLRAGVSGMVRQTWLQTLLTRQDRMDHFAFRLATLSPRIEVVLPPGARTGDLKVLVDGRPARHGIGEEGRVAIDVAASADEERVVELWYWFHGRQPPNRAIVVEPPSVVSAERAERSFWELVVPDDEHLLLPPANLTPELSWRWKGFYWARQANWNQRELERWLGSFPQDALPTATNRYLFTSFGSIEPLQIVTASRTLIMLLASGVVLVIGLLMMYFPQLRHPVVLFLAGLALATASLVVPGCALLVGQAAALGLALLLVARFLEWALGGRAARRPLAPRYLGPETSETQIPRPETPSHASTATAPAQAVPMPASESRP